MRKPRLLDLFCGAGGAAKGYQRAGFYVVGVDNRPQPHYCGDEFHQADALDFAACNFGKFDAIHASPPCQAYTRAAKVRGREHPRLVSGTRWVLRRTLLPYVIENVVGAPLINPTMLCGTMFGLRTERKRLFETSFPLPLILDHERIAPIAKMGRPAKADEFIHVVGNFSGIDKARSAMGVDWMTRDELREAIPPAYTEFIGKSLLRAVDGDREVELGIKHGEAHLDEECTKPKSCRTNLVLRALRIALKGAADDA